MSPMRPGAGLDFMAIGAHADDVELGAGGTLLRLASLGRKGVIVDLTDASMGTRGTPALRAREAGQAEHSERGEQSDSASSPAGRGSGCFAGNLRGGNQARASWTATGIPSFDPRPNRR